MLKPMFGHRPKPRKFNMPTRYYNPEEDEKKKRRIRIEMKRVSRRPQRQGVKVFAMALALAFVVYIISVL